MQTRQLQQNSGIISVVQIDNNTKHTTILIMRAQIEILMPTALLHVTFTTVK